MLQLGSLRGAANSEYSNAAVNGSASSGQPTTSASAAASRASGPFLPLAPTAHQGGPALPQGHGIGGMIHWGATAYPHTTPQQPLQQQMLQSQQQQQQQQQQQSSGVGVDSEEDDDEYRPFTPPPPRERLSYTRYQLELLNGIFQEVRYPNGTQKQLIAKRVGITREQVKIWFQNRRRKDVVTKNTSTKGESKDDGQSNAPGISLSPPQSNSQENSDQVDETSGTDTNIHHDTDKVPVSGDAGAVVNPSSISSTNSAGSDSDNPNSHRSNDSGGSYGLGNDGPGTPGHSKSCDPANASSMVPSTSSTSTSSQFAMVSPVVLRSMVAELNKFNDEYLKLKKSKKKKSKKSSKHNSSSLTLPSATLPSCKAQRLFQSYDMIAPPNKVISPASLNTSANRFKHAGGTSAFQNPRESRVPPTGVSTGTDNRLWEGLPLNPTLAGSLETSELLQQRSPPDLVHSTLSSTINFPPPAHQAHLGSFLPGTASHSLGHPQSPLYDNIPVLSDLLGSYKNHPSSATAMAAAAAAHRQLGQSFMSSTTPGQSSTIPSGSASYFHLQGGSTGSGSIPSSNSDSGKSPSSEVSFPPSPSHFSLHHPHASHFALNRVYPFPLIADPPVMLSSIRQSDSFRAHPSWPAGSPLTSQISPVGSTLPSHGSSTTALPPGGISEDPYRPLMISSLNNPYFSPSSSTFSLTSLPPPPPLWSLPPPAPDNNGSNFHEL